MKNPIEKYDRQELRKLTRFMIDHLKKGLAHASAKTYVLQNESRNFIMDVDKYIAYLDHKAEAKKK